MNRRFFLQGITTATLGLATRGKEALPRPRVGHFAPKFEDVAAQAGLTSPTVFGGRTTVGLVRFYSAAAAQSVAAILKSLQRNGHGLAFDTADISAAPIFADH